MNSYCSLDVLNKDWVKVIMYVFASRKSERVIFLPMLVNLGLKFACFFLILPPTGDIFPPVGSDNLCEVEANANDGTRCNGCNLGALNTTTYKVLSCSYFDDIWATS